MVFAMKSKLILEDSCCLPCCMSSFFDNNSSLSSCPIFMSAFPLKSRIGFNGPETCPDLAAINHIHRFKLLWLTSTEVHRCWLLSIRNRFLSIPLMPKLIHGGFTISDQYPRTETG